MTTTVKIRGKTIVDPKDHRHFYSEKIATLLGHVTIHWAALENDVQYILCDLSESLEIGDILIRKLGMERWLEDLYLVARHRIKDDAVIKELAQALAKVKDVQVKRNNLVHGLFAANFKRGQIGHLAHKPKGKKIARRFQSEQQTITTKELDSLIAEIHDAYMSMANWHHKHVHPIGRARILPPLQH